MGLKIDSLITGGILVTYKCTVECSHCRHNASPKRDNSFISEITLNNILTKLEKLGCQSVHIEGGEPFIFPKELARAVKQISNSKVELEHIVTNCSWYRNKKDTLKLLKELQENGLRRLVLKVGPFQNESIPLKKVQNIAQVAETIGLTILIWDSEFYPEVAAFDTSKTHSLKKYQKKYGEDYIHQCAKRFNVTFSGRSFTAYENHLSKVSVNEILRNCNGGCIQRPGKHHFHIDLEGNFIFSNTNGVSMNFNDLGKEIDKTKYPILNILHKHGVAGLLRFAKSEYQFEPQSEYISKCHMCHSIRTYLVNDTKLDSADLKPIEFYQ